MGMSKYDRLLYILNLLRSRRNLNAQKLAEECGVTERSIYRDLVALSEANVPIYYDNGYKLASSNFLPPLNFDLDEYQCLKLALESSPLNKTARYQASLKRIKAKVEAGLSDTVKQKHRFTPDPVHIEIPTTAAREKGERFYGLIEEAVTKWRCLRLTYDSITTGVSERVVEPHFIVFRGRAFYFVAYCRMRQDFRTFRIDRVVDVALTDERFDRREEISPETYFQESWEVYGGEPVEVVVRFRGAAARVIASGKHHPRESVERVGPDEILYRVTIRGLDEIQRWLLGFGGEAEVLQPPELRSRLARIGTFFAQTYGESGS